MATLLNKITRLEDDLHNFFGTLNNLKAGATL
jgi:hypothetical protein